MSDAAGVARAVRAALGCLAREPEGALAARFTAPLVTAIVAESTNDEWLVPALDEVSRALERVGVPRGRQFVLLGQDGGANASRVRAHAARLRDALSLAAFAHDPAGVVYTAGRAADGTPIELDDELREAEAMICIGRGFAAAGRVLGGPYLLAPGVASGRTRRAFEQARARGGERAALALALEAESFAPVDLAVCRDDRGHVVAGRGRECFAALARAASLD